MELKRGFTYSKLGASEHKKESRFDLKSKGLATEIRIVDEPEALSN